MSVFPESRELAQELDGERENDCRILLGRNVGQRLKVSELKSGRRLGDDVGGFLQSPGGLLLALGRDDLCSGLAGGFGLGGHGALKLLGQSYVFDFHSFHLKFKKKFYSSLKL